MARDSDGGLTLVDHKEVAYRILPRKQINTTNIRQRTSAREQFSRFDLLEVWMIECSGEAIDLKPNRADELLF
jgi:hypothetical protein